MPNRRKRPRDPNQLGKLIVDIAAGEVEDRPPTPEEEGKDPAAASIGRRGGDSTGIIKLTHTLYRGGLYSESLALTAPSPS
jgi:hypothetical protein